MLVDTAEIELRAGNGGDGIVSWRREKYVPRGGPDGGDGGNGGSIFFTASHDLDTLSSFRYRKVFQAQNGERGMSKKKTGAKGEDLEILVPVGTVVTRVEDGQVVADFTETGQRQQMVKGGRGGLGNVHFATATHQNPMEATKGTPGQVRRIRLELRLVADLALIGEPNAGKSSLLKKLTDADVRIGDYAFSTTTPSLGVLKIGKKKLTLVDLPGLLEGAYRGKGLGDKFLQHTLRVKALIHVIDATSNVDQSIETIENELQQYNPTVAKKPCLRVINKVDLLSKAELADLKKRYRQAQFISVESGEGINELVRQLSSFTT